LKFIDVTKKSAEEMALLRRIFTDWAICTAPVKILSYYGPILPDSLRATMQFMGKRARTTTDDKQVKLAGMKAELAIKMNLLSQSEVPCIRDFARQLAQRQNHLEWFDRQIQAQSTATLKDLNTQLVKTSNSAQKVRLISKMLFDQLMERVAGLEHEVKLLKQIQDGLLDSYVQMVTATAYMTQDGTFDWSEFSDSLETLVGDRLREEGRAEAAARMRID
jgi:hypothetical protein